MSNELDIVGRLRGKVRVPVNDGAGLLNGQDFFERSFPASRMAMEAADEIERMKEEAAELRYEAGMYRGLYEMMRDKLHLQRKGCLTAIAAECHRTKWQFDFNDENRLPIGRARDMVKRAFGELHRIGDLALKLRDGIDINQPTKGE